MESQDPNKKNNKKRGQSKGYYGGGGAKKMWKDKRERKQQRKEEEKENKMRALRGEAPKERENYELREYVVGNDKFNEYYRRQFAEIIQSEEEFEEFKKTLVEKLPVTFRVNPGLPSFQTVVNMFQDPNFLVNNAISEQVDQK